MADATYDNLTVNTLLTVLGDSKQEKVYKAKPVFNKTSNYTLLSSEKAGFYHTKSASSGVHFYLPSPAVGLEFEFNNMTTNGIQIHAPSNVVIYGVGVGNQTSAGGYIGIMTPYAHVMITCPDGVAYIIKSSTGTWTFA